MQDVSGCALALRRRRPRDHPREHRGPLRRDRVRAGDAGRRGADLLDRVEGRRAALARRRHLDQADLGDGDAAHLRVRLRLRAQDGPPQGDGRAQGEHHEVQRRALAARRARGRCGELRHRVRRPDRGQHVHAARAAAGGVRHARAAEPLRRRALRSLRRDDRRARACARCELRRRRRRVRADARLGAEVRRPEQDEPDGAAPLGDADAPPPRRETPRQRTSRPRSPR